MIAVGDILIRLENSMVLDIRAKYFIYFLSTFLANYFDLTEVINIRNLSEMIKFKAHLVSKEDFSHRQCVHLNK